MTCNSCVKDIENSLKDVKGIKNVDINLANGSVVIESILPILDLQKKLEATGKQVAIKGYDGTAAVSILEVGEKNVQGVVRFVQASPDTCIIDGTIDGLKPGKHNISIHECGDISKGCTSVGKVFNPENNTKKRIYGNIGIITAERNGRAEFRLEDNIVKLSECIGRSFVINMQL
ncbi:copper chaperone for superoxide dismutase-like [Rhynchophorus ferrugineus]|uniref:copper chaperone for superoxide dismutase-like n=1 Tax=Rhynchophorus ferrugineus TaxID=354439 RepID=UPI003FCECC70